MVKSGVNRLTRKMRGLLRKLYWPTPLEDSSLRGALRRQRQVPIGSVIDVGASTGLWSAKAMQFFACARYLLIEAQAQVHGTALEAFCAANGNAEFVLAAAGPRRGVIHFDASDPFSGQASDTPYAENNLEVPVTTIDHEIAVRRLPPPYLIKLDTHGFELPILEGAAAALAQTNLLIVEVYNYRLSQHCLRFHEMCAYLEERGFRCDDLFDVMRRPKDSSLWQMDMVFIPATSPRFADCRYQ
jgi:FkbM family methyltransferase